ncbi:MAG: PaaI family thioesterase [Methylococcales bacterium]|jgi:acyl-coenzyme A thioesterase PaaI-like protein|nr:PaaI family thioesterase [Methylococcales bacterium]MEE2767376.1 PaaI family thioesterase [Pseudomonadota bacterium]
MLSPEPLTDYFQKYMPGNVCFGCGPDNPYGLKIKSYWQDEWCVCDFRTGEKHQGWPGLVCGGIISTLVDCHCMASAMVTATRNENRALGSEPRCYFATGTLHVRFIKPTPIETLLTLKARVTKIRDHRIYTLDCFLSANDETTVEAEVIAFLVSESRNQTQNATRFSG